MLVITIENPLLTGVGIIGNIVSFMVTLSPLPTFYKIYSKKTTGSFDSLPYSVSLFSALLWMYYGLLTLDTLLLTINSTVVYTLKLIFLFNTVAFGALVVLTMLFTKGKRRIAITGGISSSFAASVFVAPLNIIRLVIKTKSVEYMPFTLSFFLTLGAIAWFSYGMVLKDFYIALPNVLGLFFGVTQMVVYFIYMNAKKDDTKSDSNNQGVLPITNSASDVELPELKSTSETALGVGVNQSSQG